MMIVGTKCSIEHTKKPIDHKNQTGKIKEENRKAEEEMVTPRHQFKIRTTTSAVAPCVPYKISSPCNIYDEFASSIERVEDSDMPDKVEVVGKKFPAEGEKFGIILDGQFTNFHLLEVEEDGWAAKNTDLAEYVGKYRFIEMNGVPINNDEDWDGVAAKMEKGQDVVWTLLHVAPNDPVGVETRDGRPKHEWYWDNNELMEFQKIKLREAFDCEAFNEPGAKLLGLNEFMPATRKRLYRCFKMIGEGNRSNYFIDKMLELNATKTKKAGWVDYPTLEEIIVPYLDGFLAKPGKRRHDAMWELLDEDVNGLIDADDIVRVMGGFGEPMEKSEAEAMISDCPGARRRGDMKMNKGDYLYVMCSSDL